MSARTPDRAPGKSMTTRILGWTAGLAVLGIAGLAAWLYAPDKSRAELEATYAGDYRTVEGVRVRFRDTGPRDAPAILLLHGFGASLESWEPWAKALSGEYRVIRLDLPGFGMTGADPSGDYTDARSIRILTGLMDQLSVRSANVIGNSLGGRIAWTLAAEHPGRVNRLVLISPDGFASPGFEYGKAPDTPVVMRALPYAAPRSMLKANLAAAYANPERLSEENVALYHDMMLAPGVRQAILDRLDQTILRNPEPVLAGITTPTLLLWGVEDGMIPISNAVDYLDHMPNARLVRLPGLGHVPFEEDPAGSLPPVRQFLAETTP